MAEIEALIVIAKTLSNQLASPSVQELEQIRCFKPDFGDLRRTVTTIRSVLPEVALRLDTRRAVKGWVQRLGEAMSTAIDLLQVISDQASKEEGCWSFLCRFASMLISAHKLKQISQQIDAITKEIDDYKFLATGIDQQWRHSEEMEDTRILKILNFSEVIGLEEAKLSHLMEVQILDRSSSLDLEAPWAKMSRLRTLKVQHMTWGWFLILKYLTSLESLSISILDDEEEEEEDSVWKPLQKLRSIHLGFGYGFSHNLPHGINYLANSLRELTLSQCEELCLSWTAIFALNRLETLWFHLVEGVVNIDSPQTQNGSGTSSVKKMIIGNARPRVLLDIPWKAFTSMTFLKLESLWKLESLPEEIKYLISLESLVIYGCTSMVALPYWINCFSSLTYLQLENCSEELKTAYDEGTGEQWPHIQHIRTISIT